MEGEEEERIFLERGITLLKKSSDEMILSFSTESCRDQDRWYEAMPSLEKYQSLIELNLHKNRYITHLHESVCHLHQLKRLILTRCEKLVTLPLSIGLLQNLEELNMMDCSEITHLPDSIGDLKMLQKFALGGHYGSGNKKIKVLPDTLGNCSNLKQLILDKCKELQCLPSTIGNLKLLSFINMRECKCVATLPNEIVHCTSLVEVSFSKCMSLQTLPTHENEMAGGFWNTCLEDLILSKCKSLTELPSSIGLCQHLVLLDLRNCKSLTMLPETLGNLASLKVLDCSGCKKLQSVPSSLGASDEQKAQLQRIDLTNCISLLSLPPSVEQNCKHFLMGWEKSKQEEKTDE